MKKTVKRLTAVFVCGALLCSGIINAGAYTVKGGDVNGDSKTDYSDLEEVGTFLSGGAAFDMGGLAAADVDGNGIVGESDYNMIKKAASGDIAENELTNRILGTEYGYFVDSHGFLRYTVDLLGNKCIAVDVSSLSECYVKTNDRIKLKNIYFFDKNKNSLINNAENFSILESTQSSKALGSVAAEELPVTNNIYTVALPENTVTMYICISPESTGTNCSDVQIYGSLMKLNDTNLPDEPSSGALDYKNWCVMGDSISNSPLNTLTESGASYNYYSYIQAETGCNITNLAVAGSGYSFIGSSLSSGLAPAFEAVDSIPENTDVITMFMGTNDFGLSTSPLGSPTDTLLDKENYLYGGNTVCGFINEYIDRIKARFPNTPFGIISPLTRGTRIGTNETHYSYDFDNECFVEDESVDGWLYGTTYYKSYTLEDLVNTIKQICEIRGVPFLDMYHGCLLHPENDIYNSLYFKPYGSDSGDRLHPNALGHMVIYKKIKAFTESLF